MQVISFSLLRPVSCYLAWSATNHFKNDPTTDWYCTSCKSLGSAKKFYISCYHRTTHRFTQTDDQVAWFNVSSEFLKPMHEKHWCLCIGCQTCLPKLPKPGGSDVHDEPCIPEDKLPGDIATEQNGNNQDNVQDGDHNEAPPTNPAINPAHLVWGTKYSSCPKEELPPQPVPWVYDRTLDSVRMAASLPDDKLHNAHLMLACWSSTDPVICMTCNPSLGLYT